MNGILLSDDLIFSSKVTGTARAVGATVVVVARSLERFAELMASTPPTGVILDLNFPGLEIAKLMAELHATCPVMPSVTGYGSHVDVATLKAARAAGCQRVMARSQFVQELETHLAEWLTRPAS
jgi:DNA-binding NarL/FixJ family response regulator